MVLPTPANLAAPAGATASGAGCVCVAFRMLSLFIVCTFYQAFMMRGCLRDTARLQTDDAVKGGVKNRGQKLNKKPLFLTPKGVIQLKARALTL